MHQQPMVPDHGTQYEESPSSHHRGMHENRHPDGQTDCRIGPFPIFPDSAYAEEREL